MNVTVSISHITFHDILLFFAGCLPLLIQLLHGSDKDSGLLGNTRGSKAARARAAAALHNIVHSHPDDKRGRREARVLRLLEQIRAHCDQLRGSTEEEEEENQSRTGSGSADIDHHPGPAIAALMKLSFDEEHRHAICTLGKPYPRHCIVATFLLEWHEQYVFISILVGLHKVDKVMF